MGKPSIRQQARFAVGQLVEWNANVLADAASDVWERHYRELLVAARTAPYSTLERMTKEVLGE